MGNVRAFARDLGAGFVGLFARQVRFSARRARDGAMPRSSRSATRMRARWRGSRGTPLIYVGTAKSVYVAPYGPGERRILRAAQRVFVRDAATAADLRRHGVAAEAPGNVIVDLARRPTCRSIGVRRCGSRCCRVRANARTPTRCGSPPSSPRCAGAGSRSTRCSRSHRTSSSRVSRRRSSVAGLRPWTGPLGALLHGATIAIGQSGTANEAAAARRAARRRARPRRRTARCMVPQAPDGFARRRAAGRPRRPRPRRGCGRGAARRRVRRARMGALGRERMGGPGGARAIAGALVALAAAA